MRTKAEDRKWMKAAAEEHGCMESRRFCDSFDCTTVHRLIADVEEATLLLGEWMNGKELPPNWTDRVRTYLQEPNKGVDSDKK